MVVFIGLGTLFPYNFSLENRRSLTNSFGLAKDIAARGTDLLIGVDGGLGQPFKGRIDDLRIYRRALTPAEIAEDAASSAASADPDLVLSYDFDESSPERVQGRRGGALRFSGAREYVRVPNSPGVDISGRAITISVWLALEGPVQRFDQTILAKPWHANSAAFPWYQYAIEFDSNSDQSVDFYFADTSGRPRGGFPVKPPVGPWTHVAFTYDGTHVRGYVDGREQLSRGLNRWQPWDAVRNVLLFLPLGFALGAVMREKYSAPVIIVLAAVIVFPLSGIIEILQSLLPNRYSSFVDIVTNMIGAAAGGMCYVLADLKFRKRM
jgi:VanZ family protein